MSSMAVEFLVIVHLRDEINKGIYGYGEGLCTIATPEQRKALDRRYIDLAKLLLERVRLEDEYARQQG